MVGRKYRCILEERFRVNVAAVADWAKPVQTASQATTKKRQKSNCLQMNQGEVCMVPNPERSVHQRTGHGGAWDTQRIAYLWNPEGQHSCNLDCALCEACLFREGFAAVFFAIFEQLVVQLLYVIFQQRDLFPRLNNQLHGFVWKATRCVRLRPGLTIWFLPAWLDESVCQR